MAQHPEKLKWRDAHPEGLSASQFGMALGFCGRVSDYVHYQRHVVGTEQEFKGNAFTAHGINTEAKSRALYELLTGCRVHDGGFFVTADRVLGCSPDGQVFYDVAEPPLEQRVPLSMPTPAVSLSSTQLPPTSTDAVDVRQSGLLAVEDEQQQQLHRSSSGSCSVRVPFKGLRRPRTPVSWGPSRQASKPVFATNEDTQGATRTGSGEGSSTWASADFQKSNFSPNTGVDGAVAAGSVSVGAAGCDHKGGGGGGAESRSSKGPTPPLQHRVRLLEIKSPFRALYDCTKPDYRPFGIPTHYMCQVQGQLAVADCEECDFFVYLDHPACQVEGWRVRRSHAFWAWAEPNLRSVSGWIKDGPPDWLNRAFAFPHFDFSTIEVVPLVFPFDVTANAALSDARRFAFFARLSSPYVALERRREDARRRRAGDSGLSLNWCHAYAGAAWADLTESERVAVAAQTPAVHALFTTPETSSAAAGEREVNAGRGADAAGDKVQLWSRLSAWRRVLEEEGVFEASATAAYWKAWTCTAAAGRDPLVRVTLSVPDDWEPGRVVVRCDLPVLPRTCALTDGVHEDTAYLGLERRLFFASLVRDSSIAPADLAAAGSAVHVAAPEAVQAAEAFALATPAELAPVFLSPSPVNSQASRASGRPPNAELVPILKAFLTPHPSQHSSTITSSSSSVVCLSYPRPSPPQHQLQHCFAAPTQPHTRAGSIPHSSQPLFCEDEEHHTEVPGGVETRSETSAFADHAFTAAGTTRRAPCVFLKKEDVAAREIDAVPIFAAAAPFSPAHATAPRQLVREITAQDLVKLLHLAEDCEGVVLVATSHAPQRHYCKPRRAGDAVATRTGLAGDEFTLLLGDTPSVRQALCCGSTLLGTQCDATMMLRTIWAELGGGGGEGSASVPLVPCLLHHRGASPLSLRKTLRQLDGVPCFVIHSDDDPLCVLQSVVQVAQRWSADL